jgi:hypothetical protein
MTAIAKRGRRAVKRSLLIRSPSLLWCCSQQTVWRDLARPCETTAQSHARNAASGRIALRGGVQRRFFTLTFSLFDSAGVQAAVSTTWARNSNVFLTLFLSEKLPWASVWTWAKVVKVVCLGRFR